MSDVGTIHDPQYSPRSLTNPTDPPYARAHQVIKNYVLEFCQLLFDGQNFPLAWDAEQGKTAIGIVDKYTFNLDQVLTRPCIVANRGPMAWANQGGIGKRQALDLRTGKVTYTDLLRGGVTLSCFSRSGLEAESIAGFLLEAFTAFRGTLRNMTNRGKIISHRNGLFKVEAVTMGEEALVKSNGRPDLSVVPVAISAWAQRRWSVVPGNAAKLKQVITRTSTDP